MPARPFSFIVVIALRLLSPLLIVASLALAGCGAAPGGPNATAPNETSRSGAGVIHAIVQTETGLPRTLEVDYAAAGMSAGVSDEGGSLVIVGVFRDGRVDDTLDLETLSISIPLSELPGTAGALDVALDAAVVNVLLEGSAEVITPEAVRGVIHVRYDAPPRPGITLRGDFSLVVDAPGAATLKLDGEFEVPVLGG